MKQQTEIHAYFGWLRDRMKVTAEDELQFPWNPGAWRKYRESRCCGQFLLCKPGARIDPAQARPCPCKCHWARNGC